ncbi:hypothetical protein V2G26_005686 [Clonostachys chloroleuca]
MLVPYPQLLSIVQTGRKTIQLIWFNVQYPTKDAHDNEPPAAEELLHVQVESDPAPIYDEFADFSIDSSIEALYLAPATQMSAEMASLENSDAEARNERASTSLSSEDPPTPQVVDEKSEDEWEAVEIIGEEVINGKLHYTVEWRLTAVPEEDCVNMRELIEEWKKSTTHRQKGGKGPRSPTVQLAQKTGVFEKATKSHEKGKKSSKDFTKRPRGRPRKV